MRSRPVPVVPPYFTAKACVHCGEVRPPADFYVASPSRLSSWCRPCTRLAAARSRALSRARGV